MKKLSIIIFLIWASFNWASNYYVDKNANGNNNGTSWANAWQSLSAINWNSIQPGDIIYISGGTDSTVYYETLEIEVSGTAANPITIRNSYEPGHNGRVILDGVNNSGSGIYIQRYDYLYLKGLEVRNYERGIYIHRAVEVVTIDSCIITSCGGVHIDIIGNNSITNGSCADSIVIKNCTIITDINLPSQTDGIYAQHAANITLYNNFVWMRNASPVNSHSDCLQGHWTRGWKIYNNVFIADSNAQGMAMILGAESLTPTSDSVIVYNNYFYMGGIWYNNAPYVAVGNTRWYSQNYMPPTFIIHNTFVSRGPFVEGFRFYYPAIFKNNIVAQYGNGFTVGSQYWEPTLRNSYSSHPVDNISSNLLWSQWRNGEDPAWSGNYTGNGNTGTPGSWSNWVNTYGGTGVNSNPLFLNDTRTSNGYVIKSNSPARNAGENLQALIESFGLSWTDIDGNLRDNSPDIGAYQYSSGSGTTFSLSVEITNDKNLVSVPGINPDGMGVDNWWEYRDLSANVFKFSNGYVAVTTTLPGVGYWMKHSGSRTYNTGDEWPATGIQKVAHLPLNVTSGWNMIGGYDLSVDAANVTTNPPGLLSGPIYRFSGGYYPASTIDPGHGYWVKLTGPGQIILPQILSKGEKTKEWFSESWGKIILTDASETSYTLYAVNGEVDLSHFELPPPPLEGMFDIRFSTGRIAENLNSAEQTIEMSGIKYPVRVKVENMNMALTDEYGEKVNAILKNGEEVLISDDTVNRLKITSSQVLNPVEYLLEQNYPNPFNPSTTIKFSLPEDVSNVNLSIYNVLGEKVAELVNTTLSAGRYSYEWNAQNVATGMYIYELRADSFVSTKKMVLLK